MKDAAFATVRVKVSGVTTPEDAEIAVEAGADWIACVFFATSPRYVTLEQAWRVRHALNNDTRFVGIFVDTPVPLVRRVMDHCGLDFAQLFGQESREVVDAVGQAFKAASCTAVPAVETLLKEYGGRKPPLGGPGVLLHLMGPLGGAWDVARPVCEKTSTILAASQLLPENVERALQVCRPWGLDVWDAVEAQPGRLDSAKLIDFIAAVREADRSRNSKEAE